MAIQLPNLKEVGSDLDVTGQKGINFPSLERVGGNFVIIGTNMKELPVRLKHVGGDVILSDKEPPSLLEDAKKAKLNGTIKGNIWCLIRPM